MVLIIINIPDNLGSGLWLLPCTTWLAWLAWLASSSREPALLPLALTAIGRASGWRRWGGDGDAYVSVDGFESGFGIFG